jgi:monooxygenase
MLDSLKSGYVQRAKDTLPRQGNKLPWKVLMHYGRDSKMLLEEPIEDGVLQFDAAPRVDNARTVAQTHRLDIANSVAA